MSEAPVVAAPAVAPKPSDIAPTAPHVEPAVPVEGEADLRDAGKKALDSMKAEVKAAKAEAKTAAEERDRLKAASEGREAEWEAEKKTREVTDSAYRKGLIEAKIEAAATRKGVAPELATKLIDASGVEVNDDGTVDSAALDAAIEALVEKYPSLAAQGARFTGTPDAGTRNGTGTEQLTKADIASMTPEQINKARKDGRLNNLLGIT